MAAALVHDFFVQDGGAERCAVQLASLVPDADVYTTFFDRRRFQDRLDPGRVHTWPMQHIPGAARRFRALLPAYPMWFETLDLRRYDLVISSSVAFAKAVRTREDAVHVAYVYTPMRYAWRLDEYLEQSGLGAPGRAVAKLLRPTLKAWDRRTSARPRTLVAISEEVRRRIARFWGYDSEVIYPPVPVEEVRLSTEDEGYFLVAARLLGYRRLDLAVRACTLLRRQLVVVGEGPERRRLQEIAGPTVRFVGHVDRERLLDLLQGARAYLVPGVEDFGIAPVEAMAAGKPVIAFAGGGCLETVVDGETGLFFRDQDPESLASAILAFDDMAFDPLALRRRAELFSTRRFIDAWSTLLDRLGVPAHMVAS